MGKLNALFGEEFRIKSEHLNDRAKAANSKWKKPKEMSTASILRSKNVSIAEKLETITREVIRILGVYKEETILLDDLVSFKEYIDASIKNKIIVIDTETNNSLDPLTCKLMGLCLYTPGRKNAYVPVNHTDENGILIPGQITEEQIRQELERVNASDCKIIYHNAKFDYEVIYCTCGIKLRIDWDTYIGAIMLDENERAGLKEQYITKLDPTIEKYSIEKLFKDIKYNFVSPAIFALYAATDSFMTYKLYEWQRTQFALPENRKIYNVFMEVEMPMVEVCAEMELTGICLDEDYSNRLSAKYHALADSLNVKIDAELHSYDAKINAWRQTAEANYKEYVMPDGETKYLPPLDPYAQECARSKDKSKIKKSKSEKLDTPINLASPTQLIIFLYDVLGLDPVTKSTGKGAKRHDIMSVDEEALTELVKTYDITLLKLLLEQRGLNKLISTYIDKLPTCVSPRDGRLHAGFKQLGAATGRMSSNEPNIQNIPSKNPEIRMMFTASPGYVMVGSDFSQQEPRLLANYSQDENMIGAYKNGKDLYATVAAQVYHNNYEDNKEFYPDGRMNPEGKKRRTNMKSLLLGIMYGRGIASIADQIKPKDHPVATKEDIAEAQKIQEDFFNSFPKVKKWMDETNSNARKYGYVEDLWGRRRRLPDIQLPEFSYELASKTKFNPLLGTSNSYEDPALKAKALEYINQVRECKYNSQREKIKEEAAKLGIVIHNNMGYISQAERQCVNARVQGGAATMSKKAMIKVHHDQRLKELGFRLLFPVHDELIGECPVENVEEVKERLSYLMIHAAEPECIVPMKCDADDFKSWYLDVYTADVKKEYKDLQEKGNNDEIAFNMLYNEHTECTRAQLAGILAS